jgi:hypothetical protein
MYLPVYRLFWFSSLAYPNLLGTKGYVVVVVLALPLVWWSHTLLSLALNATVQQTIVESYWLFMLLIITNFL